MEIDYSKYQTTSAIPEASSMIETFRAIGYNIETAVADIIDNSISAGASNVWISFEWNGSATWLAIKDDGFGMDNEELVQAMRPGSKNPLDDRSPKDLGRFGLGLKTASFSQCRKLTVLSKKKSFTPVYWTWDLDYVNQSGNWNLLKFLPKKNFENELNSLSSGTVVLWNDLDRLIGNCKIEDEKQRAAFLSVISRIEKHLSMVFHRFIETNKISISINGRKIVSWDPYMLSHTATQSFPEEPALNSQITIKGFVLPHKSKIGSNGYEIGKGPEDSWTAQQGFYVYRNDRLLVAGNWLGLFKREIHYDLCRIKIDLSNKFDIDWQIDIKKSIARPPSYLTEQIRSYAKDIRSKALEVYRHRGKILKRTLAKELFKPVWNERIINGKRSYEINRTHPAIADLIEIASEENQKLILKALKYIEETVPVQLITLKENEQETIHATPFENNSKIIVNDILKAYYSLISKGNTVEQAKRALYYIEPFDHFPEIIENINEL